MKFRFVSSFFKSKQIPEKFFFGKLLNYCNWEFPVINAEVIRKKNQSIQGTGPLSNWRIFE